MDGLLSLLTSWWLLSAVFSLGFIVGALLTRGGHVSSPDDGERRALEIAALTRMLRR